ncbi:ABC transporter ATP-binding protein [Alkalibacter rhizosphaerae]|uniref:ABC transporter ATP-binding protein n=1 Tax=Alkalibacter rhizosphaerae TaxID=2815577 RepID=A0A974XH47_9FIRM|nr:ABC transporter ATP-binding protein [Alkalibacter rhizosphaerae]QSX08540.1 ABC transporter ATP-binding protein [Alkalibacter rhizosphaerae]
MKAYKTLMPFLKRNVHRYVIGILLLMLVDGANLLVPQVLRSFTDWAQTGELTTDRIWVSVLWIMGLGSMIALGRFIWRTQLFGTAKKLEYWLRDKLFRHYLSLDADYYKHAKTGDLMAHATNDVKAVSNTMGAGIMMIIDSIFMTLLTVVMMVITVGMKISMVALLALPFISLAIGRISKPVQRRSRMVQNTFSKLTTEVQENLSGIRVIKASGVEKIRSNSFAKVNETYKKNNMDLVKLNGLFHPVIDLFSGISFVVFILYGSQQILTGVITLGDFVAVVHYLHMILWPMVALGMIANMFQRGIASMDRLNQIFAVEPQIKEDGEALSLKKADGSVSFRNVSFRYGKDLPLVLENVSFDVEPGTSLAILGRTGSGKSTVIDLLLRLYDVEAGEILFSGVPIKKLSLKALRSAIAAVPQDSFLFSKSVAENISFSLKDAAQRQVIVEAAKFAKVHEDILTMPEGYDTLVGERGVTLSGGQKQRICIARAYLRQAPLLILDDSLSAVDTETEDAILQHLRELGQSLILISQRISAVKNADQILVMDEGKIIQRGTHETLMDQVGGLYRTLNDHQLLESKLDIKLRTKEDQNHD